MDNLIEITKLFHNFNLDSRLEKGRATSKKKLQNVLNYINFQDRAIIINFKHSKYNNIISLQAKPKPCLDDTLECIWIRTAEFNQNLKSYKFLHILLTDGQKMFLARPDLKSINEEGISFNLSETCYEINSRGVRRHLCEGIRVELIQNSVIFYGVLSDFNAISFRIEVSVTPPQSFQWINPVSTVNIIFKNGEDIIYSGECKIIRRTCGQKKRTFVLELVNSQILRFKPKKFRSLRSALSPSPNIVFRHPLTKKIVTLEVEDLSGAGFSIEEYYDSSVLFPGMIIPQLEIEFANDFKINCKAQVIYRNICRPEDDEAYVRCGIAVLDMDIQDQVRLSALLHHVANKKSYVCSKVDLDALWKFFFESGFVYPEKYALISANKEKFKETYERLYIHNPYIARHFLYQDRGIIQGHISIVRFYENTWLIHHHAANRPHFKWAGLVVLEQVGRYINDFHSLYSTHMNFVICYFRPDNRFPNRVFGGCVKEIDDRKGCSLDSFAYFCLSKPSGLQDLSETGVLLDKAKPEDLLELESFYEYVSGGLMLHALDLGSDMIYSNNLNKEYQRIGFKRERHLFSLKEDGDLKAVIMVNVSDIGLNLSNLTNCIHIFVLDSNGLPRNTLYSTLSVLSKYYEQDVIPILLYPVSYVERQSMPYDKIYNLWVLNMQHTDHYFKYIENLLSHAHHK